MGGAEWFGHRLLGGHHVGGLRRRDQCLEMGVNFGGMAGESILQLHLVGVSRASDGDLDVVGEMQDVVDGADGAKLDRAAAEPV